MKKQRESQCTQKTISLLSPLGTIQVSGCENGVHTIQILMDVAPAERYCTTAWDGDVINKGVKFTGGQNPLLWWSATIPHWKQGIFVDPTRNILEKVGQIWAGTRNMRGTKIQLGLKLDFWWHTVVILPAVYLKFQKNNLFITHGGVD